jgi:lipid II:glycine glycyltransferase (peptidoglycan interpeptide bridge formation enzyme)
MLLSCGRRVIEPYGGMTRAGADARANYLLKWEAIRTSAERGHTVYDMWGLAHAGIEQFKEGFGGREVRYIGAWELVTNRPLHAGVGLARRVRVMVARRGLGAPGSAEPA